MNITSTEIQLSKFVENLNFFVEFPDSISGKENGRVESGRKETE